MINDQSHWSAVVSATQSIRIRMGKISEQYTQVIPKPGLEWPGLLQIRRTLPSHAVDEAVQVYTHHSEIAPSVASVLASRCLGRRICAKDVSSNIPHGQRPDESAKLNKGQYFIGGSQPRDSQSSPCDAQSAPPAKQRI